MFLMAEMKKEKVCPCCNHELVLEKESYPMGSAFMSDRFHVDIYRCPACGKVELFAAKSSMVVCPVCGSTHSALEKCTICALNTAFDGKFNR